MNIPARPTVPRNPVVNSVTPKNLTLRKMEKKKPCPRMLVYAVEGWGKTTMAAHSPNPLILYARDERGLDALVSKELIPDVYANQIDTWEELLSTLDMLAADPQTVKTLVLDSIGTFERLCHEYVCAKHYKNDWSENGFASFQAGYGIAASEWIKLLHKLDKINSHGVIILILGHVQVKNTKNPLGADFMRYECAAHTKTMEATMRWLDAALFGKYDTIVEMAKDTGNIAKNKGKAIGGTERIIHTQGCDAFQAKNRYGMPTELEIPGDRTAAWDIIWNAIINKAGA